MRGCESHEQRTAPHALLLLCESLRPWLSNLTKQLVAAPMLTNSLPSSRSARERRRRRVQGSGSTSPSRPTQSSPRRRLQDRALALEVAGAGVAAAAVAPGSRCPPSAGQGAPRSEEIKHARIRLKSPLFAFPNLCSLGSITSSQRDRCLRAHQRCRHRPETPPSFLASPRRSQRCYPASRPRPSSRGS